MPDAALLALSRGICYLLDSDTDSSGVGFEKDLCGAQNGGVAAVRVEGKFIFDSANHRDFLGACLGTGIERGKVGDILVTGETGAQIMVAPELVQHLEASLVQVLTQRL